MVISLQVTCCTRIAGAFTTLIYNRYRFHELYVDISKYVYMHFDKQGILGFCNTLVCVQVVLHCWGGVGGGVFFQGGGGGPFSNRIVFRGAMGRKKPFLGETPGGGSKPKN